MFPRVNERRSRSRWLMEPRLHTAGDALCGLWAKDATRPTRVHVAAAQIGPLISRGICRALPGH